MVGIVCDPFYFRLLVVGFIYPDVILCAVISAEACVPVCTCVGGVWRGVVLLSRDGSPLVSFFFPDPLISLACILRMMRYMDTAFYVPRRL